MIVTGVMIADAAEVVDNKVNVRGGGWAWMVAPVVGPDVWAYTSFVLMVQTPPDETGRSSEFKLTTLRPDGTSVETVQTFDLPEHVNNHAMAFQTDVQLVAHGRYVFQFALGDQVPSVLYIDYLASPPG